VLRDSSDAAANASTVRTAELFLFPFLDQCGSSALMMGLTLVFMLLPELVPIFLPTVGKSLAGADSDMLLLVASMQPTAESE
jgi:hypothetical protein